MEQYLKQVLAKPLEELSESLGMYFFENAYAMSEGISKQMPGHQAEGHQAEGHQAEGHQAEWSLGRMVIRPNDHQAEWSSGRIESQPLFLPFPTIFDKNQFNNGTRKNSLCFKEGKIYELNISSFSAKNYFSNDTRKNSLYLKEGKIHGSRYTHAKWSFAEEALS